MGFPPGAGDQYGQEGGEEFPYFTDFWLVRPEPEQALIDHLRSPGQSERDGCLPV